MQKNENTKKIAINTLIMFVRMLLVMALTLYTVRITLKVIGVQDYGIYSVVAGFVSMLAVISGTMETASQRFFSFAIGEKRRNDINQIFSQSILIYLLISAGIVLLGETVGLWFLNKHLQIPESRIIVANWIYQLAVFSIVVSMISIPFSSLTIAHENMGFFALISLIDSFLKLFVVFAITMFSSDKLIVYGVLSLLVVGVKLFIYILWCRYKYNDECKYKFNKNGTLFKSMISYSGWTLFGTVAGVANNQGNNMLINIFFGPIANAAQAVAYQVSNAVSSFANNLFVVIRPPMIKSYAEENIPYMMYLFYLSSRLSYFLMFLIFLPLFLETEFILKLWLGQVGQYMLIFTKLTLVFTLILTQHNPITTIIQATGRVKTYFSIVESVTLLSLPLSYFFFKLGYPAEATLFVSIFVFIIAHILRLIILKKVIEFSIKEYLKKFIMPSLYVSIISCSMPIFFHLTMPIGLYRLITVVCISSLLTLLTIYFIGITKIERNKLIEIISKKTDRRC